MSRAGDFASGRRPRVAEHAQFVWAKDAAGVPISAIAHMIGCNVADVRSFLRPAGEAPAPVVIVVAPTPSPAPATRHVSREPRRFVKVDRSAPVISTARPIIDRHAEAAGLSLGTILSKAYPRKLRDVRDACWAELYATGRYSLPQIGGWFCRDHTTIMAGIARAGVLPDADVEVWKRLGQREAA